MQANATPFLCTILDESCGAKTFKSIIKQNHVTKTQLENDQISSLKLSFFLCFIAYFTLTHYFPSSKRTETGFLVRDQSDIRRFSKNNIECVAYCSTQAIRKEDGAWKSISSNSVHIKFIYTTLVCSLR